ncbi:hypothetical protein EMIT036CA2_10045 [Chryseobacterium sp. IT-36CA2]
MTSIITNHKFEVPSKLKNHHTYFKGIENERSGFEKNSQTKKQ